MSSRESSLSSNGRNDLVVPSTPDWYSEEESTEFEISEATPSKEIIQDSVQESFFEPSPINPAYRQVIADTDESAHSSEFSPNHSASLDQVDDGQLSRNSSYADSSRESAKKSNSSWTLKSNELKTYGISKECKQASKEDHEESYQLAGKYLHHQENLLNSPDPNESYQALKQANQQDKKLKSKKNNSMENSKNNPMHSASKDSFPNDDDSFQLPVRKLRNRTRYAIQSSEEEISSVENSPITKHKHSQRLRTIESSDSEAEDVTSLRKTTDLSRKQVEVAKTSISIDNTPTRKSSLVPTAASRTPEVLDILNFSTEANDSVIETFPSPIEPHQTAAAINNSIQEITSSPESPVAIATVPVNPSPSEISRMRKDLEQKELLLKSCRLDSLPDRGARLRDSIKALKEKLDATQGTVVSKLTGSKTSASAKEEDEDQLRKHVQMKKWALGSAVGEQRDRLRVEINELERKLIQLSVANATGSNASSVYKPLGISTEFSHTKPGGLQLFPDMPKLSDVRNEIHKRMQTDQLPKTKHLSDPPPLTDFQKQMFSDQPSKELYKKTESGYISAAARREAVSVTLDALENMHRSLASCPGESEKEPTPACLTVPLMPHQERALKWLLWRETQNPAGGILADDMGLGKTLTMISLIVRQKEMDPPPPSSTDIWLSKSVKIKRSCGTLIVCPASVVGQWENEINRRCKRNSLSVVIFHGADRNKLASKLHQYDVVITTYQIVSREISDVSVGKNGDSNPIGDFDVETQAKELKQSVLLQIAFNRIILDEAHVIRNPKSGVSQAVCRLRAGRRWAVTGTPVQNKELDMYSLLRFLRVSPFDQLPVWKRWVDSSKAKNEQATGRLQLLIKTLLLRRTKDQKAEGSSNPLVAMPDKNVHTHQIKLSEEEMEVYQKLLAFSRKALEDYLKSQENKIREEYMSKYGHEYSDPTKKNVTKQMVLVLLLRLRQVCSHPALIKTMLDTTETDSMGAEEAKIEDDYGDLDLISKMASMKIGNEEKNNVKEEETNFFTHTNPVFDQSNMSSKLKYVVDEVQKVTEGGDKAVVVSQWTSMLDIFAQHFKKLRIACHVISGNVPLKTRTEIVEDFNNNPKGKLVMLLSLNAGGVGLNLIGGNHLFLADMHWNPQLEAQACDRVFRVGQKKNVHIHRLVTVGTVEERISQLQQQKLAMANGILTGAAKLATKGLTIEDLKMLFNPGPPAYGSSSYAGSTYGASSGFSSTG